MDALNGSQSAGKRFAATVRGRGSAALAVAAGAALRLWMMKAFPQIEGDTLLYGNLARNMLLHGQYAIGDGRSALQETLIRLPGYPLFLALCFKLFGMENYNAVISVQIALDLAGCLLLAAFVRRIANRKAALWTLWLAALCPFTAAYAVAPLTETLTLFAIALALWAMAEFGERQRWPYALAFTFAITLAALLRPDGALIAVAFVPALLFGLRNPCQMQVTRQAPSSPDTTSPTPQIAPETPSPVDNTGAMKDAPSTPHIPPAKTMKNTSFSPNTTPAKTMKDTSLSPDTTPAGTMEGTGFSPYINPAKSSRALAPEGTLWTAALAQSRLTLMILICLLIAATPFAAWTSRNWRVFHVIQPLAPRYATDPGETLDVGWQRWVKTWCLDFTSTYDIYWNVPGGPFDVGKLPARAFDTPAEYAETVRLANDYAANGDDLTAEMDAQFGRLADQRVKTYPLRYYLWLPLGRLADMALRPRVENLNIDLDWWAYAHHHDETLFSWAYAALNAAYLVIAAIGLWRRPRYWIWMLLYMVLRSLMLMTIEAPETRYTLEFFPMLFALAGIGMAIGPRALIESSAASTDS